MKTRIFTQKEKEEEEEEYMLSLRYGTVYFTIKDMEKWLPIKARSLSKYLRNGRIKGRKIGKKWYVTRQEFYRFLEGK